MTKFLVIQTAFPGDVILATALIEKLHCFFPEARIDMLVRKGNESLLMDHPFLNSILVWNKKNKKYSGLLHLLKRIRNEKYDKVINLQRFATSGCLTAFSGAKEKIGFKKNPFSILFDKSYDHNMLRGLHEVQRNNQLIAAFTDDTFNKPKLYPSEKDFSAIHKYQLQKYICILPSSVWFTKQYPKEKWINFIQSVPKELHIFLLGGPEDNFLCDEIMTQSNINNIKNLAGQLSFLQSAALMKGALMNYTNDSAPLHLASSMNAPVTSIFCSTIPSFGFYPLSDNATIIETTIELPCKPCGLHGWKACPLGHFKCAYTIENTQLLETIPNASI
ncbi:MAG: glycosyltransferase family 9 protein [Bacteroidetes bacterium]|nr:glycosyltransferase family 9 protein [Bacteroidota bacterium]